MTQEHWDNIYKTKDNEVLGWYQQNPEPDFSTIQRLNLDNNARIIIIGAGVSNLVIKLLENGYNNLILTDISKVALEKLQNQIPEKWKGYCQFIVDDLRNSDSLKSLKNIDLWVDRAVLHFLVDDKDRETYGQLLWKVKPKYILLAQFSVTGASRCSGLDIYQYDLQKLQKLTGENYTVIENFDFDYINPSGDKRPYIYAVFKDNN